MKGIKAAVTAVIIIAAVIGIFLLVKFSGDKKENQTKISSAVTESYSTDTTDPTDLTDNENINLSYEMSNITNEYLSNLDKKIDFYFLMELNDIKFAAELNDFTDSNNKQLSYLISMLEQYSEYKNINFMDFDIDKNPEILSELDPDSNLDLQQGDMIIKCDNIIKKVPASEMYKIYGTYDQDGNFTEDKQYFQGENIVTSAIKAVAENIVPTVYFLTGHDEKIPGSNYTSFIKNLKCNGYETDELDLDSINKIPDNAAIIIISAPKQDLSILDKEKLNKYLDNGGNISFLMSPQNNDTIYENITEIMHEYCLDMDYSRVYETDDSKCLSGDKYFIQTQLVDISERDENLTDITSGLIDQSDSANSYMPPSRTFSSYKWHNFSDLKICPLLEACNTAEAEAYGGSLGYTRNNSDPLWISAYSEDASRNNSKIVVMGNAEFIDDEYASEGYTIVPLYLYLTTITWMSDSNIDVGIPPKEVN